MMDETGYHLESGTYGYICNEDESLAVEYGMSMRRTAASSVHLLFLFLLFVLFFYIPLGGIKETVNFILSPRLALS